MLQAINMKLLIAILAAIGAIAAVLVHVHNASERAVTEAAKTRAILEQQAVQADAHRRAEQAELQKAEEEKRKHSSNNKAAHKTWQTYVP